MSVEVRQMIVKSNVLQRAEQAEEEHELDPEEARKALLEECKRLILETLQEMKER
ncbi:MAG: hypothetical protein HY066_14035 [Betaproteobacteria bacterium]|nr:hypothetical protein [Betaproteobacteria bacterium]